MKDTLESATRALRKAPVDHARSDETRARLMAAVRQKRGVPKRRFGPWLVPIAAAFVASAALAGAGSRIVAWLAPVPTAASTPTGSSKATVAKPASALPHVVDSAVASGALAEPARAPAPTDAASTSPVAATSRGAAPSEVAAPPAATAPNASSRGERAAAAPVDLARPPVAAPLVTSAPGPAAAAAVAPTAAEPTVAAAPPAVVDPNDELYRAAHDLHFRGGSAAAAVAAWDRYLAAAPGGRFALEATFNRAIALLRAGRRAEGLAALSPFASGAHGAYRREEAKRLLDAAEDAGAP